MSSALAAAAGPGGLHRAVHLFLRSTAFALSVALAIGVGAGSATPAAAWTPASQQVIGEQAARLAPPDLYRQLVRNREAYRLGVDQPFQVTDPTFRQLRADRGGRLDAAVDHAVEQAILSIRAHRPFNEIAYRLGIVVHYVTAANDPLATGGGDATEARWAADVPRYLESAAPRVRMVFYGFRRADGRLDLDRMLAETVARSRGHYPMLGREYRRIGFRSGVRGFDDRSTAYAVAALAYSHAVSDAAEVLRYIWLAAGGRDHRTKLPLRGRERVRLQPLDADRP